MKAFEGISQSEGTCRHMKAYPIHMKAYEGISQAYIHMPSCVFICLGYAFKWLHICPHMPGICICMPSYNFICLGYAFICLHVPSYAWVTASYACIFLGYAFICLHIPSYAFIHLHMPGICLHMPSYTFICLHMHSPLNKQNKHGLRAPNPLKCLFNS